MAANNRYFSEDFEGSEVDLSENWLERSAYGTSEGDWDDRIVTDPADSGNKVYRMLWSRNSPQLLKWNKPLTSYHLSADVKGGGSYPKFEGQRAHPASIYLRTTLHNLGRPEYQSESPDLESSGHSARGGSNPPSRTNEIKGSRVFVNPGIKYKTV